MKAKLLAVAIAAALPMVASAQSNVTMFGVIDTGMTWAKSGANKNSGLAQDGIASSRFGVRGSEDLGGGLKANFHLEGAIAISGGATSQTAYVAGAASPTGVAQNGASNGFLDFSSRLAFVGLSGNSWGSVNFGRQYTPAFNIHTGYDIFGTNGVASVANITLGTTSSPSSTAPLVLGSTSRVRASNAVRWDSPNWSGFTAAVMFNFGERQNASGAERQTGFNLRYNPGWWSLGLGYNNQKDNNAAALGAANAAAVAACAPAAVTAGASINTGLTNCNNALAAANLGNFGAGSIRVRQWIFGGHVDIQKFKIVAGYQRLSDNTAASNRARDFWIGGQYATGAHTIKLEYARRNTNIAADTGDASQWGLGYNYSFSRRTTAYVQYARISNKSGSNYTNVNAAGGLALTAGALGTKSSGFQLGVSHSF